MNKEYLTDFLNRNLTFLKSCSETTLSLLEPYVKTSSLSKIINQESELRHSLEYLCAFENPEPDKIECLATVLVAAWITSKKSKLPVVDILQKAQESFPSYIRSSKTELQLDPKLKQVLDEIDGFTYNLTRGFFHWEYFGGLSAGTLPYSIETARFQKFQELINNNLPVSFDDLEVFLT